MFIADQPQQSADAIATLLANPAQAQTLTTQARAYVEQHHNLKRNTADLLAFLGQL